MNNLRPDEMTAQADIERSNRQNQRAGNIGKVGANLALTAAGLTAARPLSAGLSRVLPFLSEMITPELALKGISKVNPELGKMLNKGMKNGLNIKDGLNFIKNNLSNQGQQDSQASTQSPEKEISPAKQNGNPIEMESPELHKFILDQIKKGNSPLQAGALAFNDKKFMQAINKIKTQHKTNWADIVESIYGTEAVIPQNSQEALRNEVMNPPGSMPQGPQSAEANAAMNSQGQTQPQGQNAGGGVDPQLMAIMQQMRSTMQKLTGK